MLKPAELGGGEVAEANASLVELAARLASGRSKLESFVIPDSSRLHQFMGHG